MNDKIGSAHAVQHSKARIEKGRLQLDSGTGYAATHPIKHDLQEKTLESWVMLHGLDQRAGSAMTVQTPNGAVFDAIVFGEIEPRRWAPGSDHLKRTRNLMGTSESSTELIHMAITYRSDGTIRTYRNGKPYGIEYKSGRDQYGSNPASG